MIYPQQKQRKAMLLLTEEDNSFSRGLQSDLLDNGNLVRKIILTGEYDNLPETLQVDAVVICSCQQDPLDGIHLLERIKACGPEKPVFLVVKHGSEEKAVAALRSGATDYFSGPRATEELTRCLNHHFHDSASAFEFASPGKTNGPDADDLAGISKEIREIRDYLLKVASRDSIVLITGETGTGKELTADFIHKHSKRKEKPLIRINSSAMPEQLVESELFGYEKGAFTGAVAAKPGKFEQADGGILFLDEIGEMSSFAQAKILRILESGRVHRLGGNVATDIDVRVIAATNQNLEELVEQGKFRKDLFFRLNVARVHLPPLRQRREDIPVLLNKFVRDFNKLFGLHIKGFSEKAWFSLLKYDWPGNIRELKNVVEATCINGPADTIKFSDLPKPFQQIFYGGVFRPKSERDQVLSALFAANWNKSKAAEKLNWSRMTLYRKMAKHQIVQHRSVRTPLADIRQ
ncbi:MAG: sigma-54-dependent Fis family transcriptional regulator [Deltaproteobacteria bacterium]|nr:sigma-54-dependent Fis family transcriptional regulator [Deltaproteobacteria bacterium]